MDTIRQLDDQFRIDQDYFYSREGAVVLHYCLAQLATFRLAGVNVGIVFEHPNVWKGMIVFSRPVLGESPVWAQSKGGARMLYYSVVFYSLHDLLFYIFAHMKGATPEIRWSTQSAVADIDYDRYTVAYPHVPESFMHDIWNVYGLNPTRNGETNA